MWMTVKKAESETLYNLCFVVYAKMCYDTQTLYIGFANGDYERFTGEEANTVYEAIRKKILGGGENE